MKKIYQTPITTTVAVNVQHHILDPSQTEMPIDPTQPPIGDGDDNYVKGRGGSRGGDVWDDDWSR